ncbi:MAG: PEP/pyruvate-binding domain-containing protein [Thermodesulfobacteriota bacterium]
MSTLWQQLALFFSRRPRLTPAELQALFRDHYRSFQSLLTANNNALELMAEMEQALAAGRSFGMSFVRGHATALTVNVYKMVQQLIKLAGGRYHELQPAFTAISREIEQILGRERELPAGHYILAMDEIAKESVDQVGEKMANLGEVRNRLGLTTPDGFVITAAAVRHFLEANRLQAEINRRLRALDLDNLEQLYTVSAAIQKLISTATLPADLDAAITAAYRQLAANSGGEPLVALRSSALGEDSMNVSFAGQYRTQLNVAPEFLQETYREIVAGTYKSQAIIYREQRGFRHQDVSMCVGCLTMVRATISGVAYSRAPDDPRSPWVVIEAAPGLASQVVDGRAGSEVLQAGREAPWGILTRQSSPHTGTPTTSLTPEQAAEVARTAVRLEEHFGTPQDVEWSFDQDNTLVILQSRPIGQQHAVAGEPPPVAAAADSPLPAPLLAGGVTASRGVACGTVFKVRNSLDLLQFPKDAVLVIETPYPDWATILNRAAAVVSETGQVAAHLATVAREFGVPAIFGLGRASATLENGQLITVDATGRRVYDGRVEELLALAAPRPDLMADSPVYRLLQDALAHISPLHLTDPASPFFRPSACKTLHDITRFCHEKAVDEMFAFGERAGYANKAAKQLVVDAPSQWWVIDLDGGFREGFDPAARFVGIDDIVSVPMRAIWHGMTAVPWEGPPPVSLSGFGSIIFQSTRNPQLDPAVRSAMGGRNYFLISKNYCNLSVRLGYHFAMLEASLSELLTESYISFRFQGGAADEQRRHQRVRIMKTFLEQFDFRIEVKGDALTARLEKYPADFLMERLTVLGYLLIHTRQMDMVMGDPAAVERFMCKIHTEIEEIFNPEAKEESGGTHLPDTAG